MSLLVWLPLTEDFTNRGVLPTVFKASGSIAQQADGKIGQCHYLNGKTLSCPNFTALQQATDFSACCWIKFTSFPSDSNAYCICLNTKASNDYKFILGIHSTNGTTATFRLNVGNSIGTLNLNTWYHLAVCISGTTGYMYINGALVNTATGLSSTSAATNLIIGGRSSNASGTSTTGTGAPAYYNDVRIYNHCLTPREVKQISQGLILHMPLKDTDGEATTNVAPYPTPGASATTSFNWDQTLHPNAINVAGWAAGHNGGVGTATSGYHAHWQLIDGLPTMVFPDLNSHLGLGHRWLGINALNMQTKIGPSTTYTVSFDARADVANLKVRIGYHYCITGESSNAFHDSQSDFSLSTQWKRYSYTFTTKSTLNTAVAATFYFYGHFNTLNGTSYVRNVQIELKDHATAYTKDTRDSSLMDCSGYGHHGEGVGTLVVNNDSARYDNCIYTSDGRTNYGKSGTLKMPTDAITMSCWFKSSTTGYGSYHIPLSCGGAHYEFSIDTAGKFRNGFHINGARSVVSATASVLDGQWHMLTATYDGTTIRRYVDGTEITSAAVAATGPLTGETGNVLIGNYNGTTYGNKEAYMSDVRIYATALSTADIKILYQSRISMLENGAIAAYEYKEGELSNIKFTEEGVARAGSISEVSYIGGMKTRVLPDGSAWARIYWLDLEFEKTPFASDAEVESCEATNRFSKLGLVDHFKTSEGVYEFMLTYPNLSSDYNRWKQTSSPNVASGSATGYEQVVTAWTKYCGPLSTVGSTYQSSSVYAANSSNNWWAPIGQKALYNNSGIPAANGSTQLETELWVRIDNLPPITKLSLLDNKYIQATEIYEI